MFEYRSLRSNTSTVNPGRISRLPEIRKSEVEDQFLARARKISSAYCSRLKLTAALHSHQSYEHSGLTVKPKRDPEERAGFSPGRERKPFLLIEVLPHNPGLAYIDFAKFDALMQAIGLANSLLTAR